MTDYEIYSYEAFRRHQHDDERAVDRAGRSLLDSDQLQDYLTRMRQERPGFSRLSREEAYEMLAITRDGKPTLAAIMNFALYPQGYFPRLAITAVVVPGREIGDLGPGNERFVNSKRIEGTLQIMLSEAIAFCLRNMKVRTVIDSSIGERTDIPEYPVEAIREAVLNALIHRDYSHFTEGTPVQIDFFADRLEIHSPGGLYGRMTVEDLGKARPDLRNPALAAMSEFLLHTENRYSGIPTIRREMAALGLPEPVFVNQRNEFIVILYNSPREARCHAEPEPVPEADVGRLLDFCKTPRSRQEIADFLGIRTIYYVTRHYIQPLLDSGKLRMSILEKPKSRYQKYFTVTSGAIS